MRRADEEKTQKYTQYFDACFKNTCTSRARYNRHDEEVIHMLQPYIEIMDEDNNNYKPDLINIARERYIQQTAAKRRKETDAQETMEIVGRRWNIRSILHHHYRTTRTDMSLRQLQHSLRLSHPAAGAAAAIGTIPLDDLRAALPRLGFRVVNTRNKSTLVIEQHRLRLDRIKYLRAMQMMRKQRKPIVYFMEANVEMLSTNQPSTSTSRTATNSLVLLFAANKNGLINFTFAHKESRQITDNNFIDWLLAVIQNLPKGTVLVVEEKHYTMPKPDEFQQPTHRELLRWLKIYDVPYEQDWTMIELRNAIRRATQIDHTKRMNFLNGIKDSRIEAAAKEMGFTLIRIPRYHPELRPFINADFFAPCVIDTGNQSMAMAEAARNCIRTRLDESTVEQWQFFCEKIVEVENGFLDFERFVNEADGGGTAAGCSSGGASAARLDTAIVISSSDDDS